VFPELKDSKLATITDTFSGAPGFGAGPEKTHYLHLKDFERAECEVVAAIPQ
jgi:hypothetical protein